MENNIVNWTLNIPFNEALKKEYNRYLQIKNKVNDGYEDYLFDNFLREFFTPLFKEFSKKSSCKLRGYFKMKMVNDEIKGKFEISKPVSEEHLEEFKIKFNETMEELLNTEDFEIIY